MKILVTGGGGFLGTEICKQLLEAGLEVVNFSRHSYLHLKELGVETIKGDLRKRADLDRLNEFQFEAVFHVASLAGVWGRAKDYEEINVLGTQNILNWAQAQAVPSFIYTSTPSVVFEGESIDGGDETLPYSSKPLTDYQRTKILAEKMVLAESKDSFQTLALRPHLIFGPNDPHLFPRVLQRAREGKLKRVGDGDNYVDITFVENAAHAHVLAFKALKEKKSGVAGEAFFIGNEKPVNLWKFIDDLLISYKLPIVTSSVSISTAYWLGLMLEILFKLAGIMKPEPPMTRFTALNLGKSHFFRHDKARERLGYYPKVTVEEGLKKTLRSKLKD